MKSKIIGFLIAVAVALVIIGVIKSSTTIPAGYVGVVYNLDGGIEKDTLSQGWHLLSPTQTVTRYTIAREQSYMTKEKQGDSPENESFEIPTKEGASLEVDVAFGYSFDVERVPETFTKFRGQSGKEILTTFIKPNMQGWIKEITSRFGMMEIVATERGKINEAITEEIASRFDKYGIIIDRVSLTDVRPDKDTDKAIKKKIRAQEELATAKVNAETDKVNAEKDKEIAEINAKKDKEVAEINAEKAKIEAKGKADAKIIEAEAEAKANERISKSLTPELLEKKKIEKWNGTVPKVQGSGSTIVDTRDMTD